MTDRRSPPEPPSPADTRARTFLFALGGAIAMAHAALYAFLTDDAFISFRYARNLAHGAGLVFNAGGERVEGYTNFLWVLVLALLDRVGVRPDLAAPALSLLCTLALLAVVGRFSMRWFPPGSPWAAVPVLLLAITRSFAVWSTSGLETRAFELFVVAGLFQTWEEIEGQRLGRAAPRLPSGVLFGLAALTRPDGVLFAAIAWAVGAVALAGRFERLRSWALRAWTPCVLLVGLHLAFRWLYYGDLLPNTWYAKAAGQWMRGWGLQYLAAWVLEYSLYLWLPVLAAAFAVRSRTTPRAVFFALMLAPIAAHSAYVVSVGGDHFEFRPLDLYFVPIFVLGTIGLHVLWGRFRWVAAALAGLLAYATIALPLATHLQFPNAYLAGFPGNAPPAERDEYLHRGLLGWPPPPLLALYRDLLGELTHHFVGIRQEEHERFLGLAREEGLRLRSWVERGVLPADLHVAVDCVGAIPYYSGFRTLDRLGLTDATVARAAVVDSSALAHGKRATFEYARRQGVDLWARDAVRLSWRYGDAYPVDRMLAKERIHLIAMDPEWVLAVFLPQGEEAIRLRLPGVEILNTDRLEDARRLMNAGIAALGARCSTGCSPEERVRLGYWLLADHRTGEAIANLERARDADPGGAEVWRLLAHAYFAAGRPEARDAAIRALEITRASGDPNREARLGYELGGILTGLAPPEK